MSKLSKHGNSRLRYAFWLAATNAIRMTKNTFRKKFENYIKEDPTNAELNEKVTLRSQQKWLGSLIVLLNIKQIIDVIMSR